MRIFMLAAHLIDVGRELYIQKAGLLKLHPALCNSTKSVIDYAQV